MLEIFRLVCIKYKRIWKKFIVLVKANVKAREIEGNFRNNLVGKIAYDSTKVDIEYANYETGYFTYKNVEWYILNICCLKKYKVILKAIKNS